MITKNIESNKIKISTRIILILIAVILFGFDQLTKWLAVTYITPNSSIQFLPHWNWVLLFNTGAAFSLLHRPDSWYKYGFLLFTAIVAIGLIYYLISKNYHTLIGVGYAFILGGALGNLTDRICRGQVVDFIDWYLGNYHWPSFNLADSSILLGVIIIFTTTSFIKKT